MAYTVLARRYRSQKFDEVVGQNAISQTLKNAIKTDKVAHAYLFSGTRGVGKTTMARILAKSLNCLSADKPTVEPCLKCDSCTAINSGEDIDVIEIDGASNNSVDDVRELRQNAIYRPARARFKIYIIDEVHMLSINAFNALLKVLEEPPTHVKFIFATTEPNKVLATIQSRCQRFDFANISANDIIGQLKKILAEEKIKFEDDCIIALARLANGSMRDGLSLLDQIISAGVQPLTVKMLEELLGLPNSEKIYQLLEKIGAADAAGTLQCTDELLSSGQNCTGLLDAIIQSLRDMMILKAAQSSLVILTETEKKRLTQIAEDFDIPSLIYNIAIFEKLRWPLKNSDNPRALLEAALLRVALAEHFMSIPDLLGEKKTGNNPAERLKKNYKIEHKDTEHKSQVEHKVENSELEPQIPVFTGGADIEQLKENWSKITGSIANARIAELLKKASPLKFAGNLLTLGFGVSDEFTMKLCQGNGRLETIQQVLSQATGAKLKVSFEIISESSQSRPKAKPRGAKASKKVIDEAANSPVIKTVLSELEANIIDVEEQQ
ncbi:MAG: DNA polymerase III subunit gamma/tau [Planctomycetes bacterium HGW-Planctomycetes-1]|nr:MAG: DNA polymerase III subunit gamma/tau [Planctomycetes bacterium HGW-Planctomycetes-1]